MSEGEAMTTITAIRHELTSRLADAGVKTHLSLRYEPGPRIVRLGACIDPYNWDTRAAVLDRIVAFETDHEDDFAVDFDVVPLHPVTDPTYAEH